MCYINSSLLFHAVACSIVKIGYRRQWPFRAVKDDAWSAVLAVETTSYERNNLKQNLCHSFIASASAVRILGLQLDSQQDAPLTLRGQRGRCRNIKGKPQIFGSSPNARLRPLFFWVWFYAGSLANPSCVPNLKSLVSAIV